MISMNDSIAWAQIIAEQVEKSNRARVKYETVSCWARTIGKVDESQGLHPCDDMMVSSLGLCAYHHLEITGREAA